MNAENRVGVALIGCGRIARWFHLDALRRHPQTRLVAIADKDPDALENARKIAPNAVPYRDYREVLAKREVKAVVICLPTQLHASVAGAAFDAGKHVFVEKPLATDQAEARRVIDAWRASGRVGMVGFNNRFHPTILRTKELLRQQRVGRVNCVRCVQGSAAQSIPEWKKTRVTGGGTLLDLASHQFDLISFLLDCRPAAIHALVWSQRHEQDSAMLHVRTHEGPPVQIFVSNAAIQEHRLEVIGEEGKIVADRFESTVKILPRQPRYGRIARTVDVFEGVADVGRRIRDVVVPVTDPSYRLALDTFVRAVLGSKAAFPDIADGYQSLLGVWAAEESARCGRWIEVSSGDEAAAPCES